MPLPEFLKDLELDDLPTEYLESPLVQEAKGVSGIIKQAVDYQRLSGEQVRIPGSDSPEEEWGKTAEKLTKRGVLDNPAVQKAFKDKLGVIDKADGFKIDTDKLPEGVTFDDAKLTKWKEIFAENGLTQSQANQIMGAYGVVIGEEMTKQAEAKAARDGVLKEAFGQAYDSKMAQVFNAAAAYGDDKTVEAVKNADPIIVQMLSKVAETFKVDGDGSFTPQGQKKGISPIEARQRWEEIQPKLSDRSVPPQERKRLLRESVDLQDYMNGRQPEAA